MQQTNDHFAVAPADETIKCRSCGLAGLCIPHALSRPELDNLDSIVEAKRRIDKNETLYRAGDGGRRIFAVRSGSFKTTVFDSRSGEQITGFYLPGEIVGLDGLGGICPDSTAIALETSTVCEISAPHLDRLCAANEGLRNSFMQIISREIAREQRMMLVLGQMTAEARLANLLTVLGARFKERGFCATEFNLSMSRYDIANYLGLAVETLSRLINKFHRLGHTDIAGRHVKILDWDALCRLSGTGCGRKISAGAG